MNASNLNELERIRLAQAINLHRLHNYIVVQCPDDCHPDDIRRMEAEAQLAHPLAGIICRTYCTVRAEERALNPGARWKLV